PPPTGSEGNVAPERVGQQVQRCVLDEVLQRRGWHQWASAFQPQPDVVPSLLRGIGELRHEPGAQLLQSLSVHSKLRPPLVAAPDSTTFRSVTNALPLSRADHEHRSGLGGVSRPPGHDRQDRGGIMAAMHTTGDEARATVAVFGLGGTISMKAPTGTGAAVPALSAGELLAGVPGLDEV